MNKTSGEKWLHKLSLFSSLSLSLLSSEFESVSSTICVCVCVGKEIVWGKKLIICLVYREAGRDGMGMGMG